VVEEITFVQGTEKVSLGGSSNSNSLSASGRVQPIEWEGERGCIQYSQHICQKLTRVNID
jgi:hypothetical protein